MLAFLKTYLAVHFSSFPFSLFSRRGNFFSFLYFLNYQCLSNEATESKRDFCPDMCYIYKWCKLGSAWQAEGMSVLQNALQCSAAQEDGHVLEPASWHEWVSAGTSAVLPPLDPVALPPLHCTAQERWTPEQMWGLRVGPGLLCFILYFLPWGMEGLLSRISSVWYSHVTSHAQPCSVPV